MSGESELELELHSDLSLNGTSGLPRCEKRRGWDDRGGDGDGDGDGDGGLAAQVSCYRVPLRVISGCARILCTSSS